MFNNLRRLDTHFVSGERPIQAVDLVDNHHVDLAGTETTCLMPTTGSPRTWAQLGTSLPLVLQSVFDIRTY